MAEKVINLADEKKIAQLMKTLDITREEAIEVIQEDAEIDKGSTKYELTGEAAKISKKMRQADRKKTTTYNFDTSKRERKVDPVKKDLIAGVAEYITQAHSASEMAITNDQRQIDFKINGVRYRIVLSAPRKE